MDKRIEFLADRLVNYSCKVQPKQRVLIAAQGHEVLPLAKQVIREVYKAGAYPFVEILETHVTREIMLECSEEQLKVAAELELQKIKSMDAYIGIRGTANAYELADVPQEKLKLYNKMMTEFSNYRVDHTNWVVLRYPNPAMAQMAGMSTEGFSDFYYNVCNLDYGKMANAMENLKTLMEKTDQVHIVGPGTDLRFSIKGMNIIPCSGQLNIPDGEVYTAPIRDSVNGKLSYNISSPHEGFIYDNICLEFKDGKIINATANDTERINRVFDIDEGARYIGEFAIGVNPYITKPMNDILFDEKIAGSFHFTPGKAYDDAFNGNKSDLHWDLVCIQTEEYGGGQIYFDDVLVRNNGLFVLDELLALNPENLK